MNEIPQFGFREKSGRIPGFQIMPVKSLLALRPRLSHPLHRPFRLSFFTLLYITEGTGRHFIDFKEVGLGKGTAAFVSRGQVQAFEEAPAYGGYQVLFTGEFLQRHFINPRASARFLPGTVRGEFANLAEEMAAEYALPENEINESILACLLKLFLLKIERLLQTGQDSSTLAQRTEFGRLEETLETRFIETRNARDYAEMLGISYDRLNELCRTCAEMTAKEFIDSWIALEIKRRLVCTPLSVKELAYQTGFDEPTNFVKFFKRKTGFAPSDFRNAFR